MLSVSSFLGRSPRPAYPTRPVRIEFSGSYRLDDTGTLADNASDIGTLDVGRRTHSFTSGSAAAECSEGEVWTLSNARVEDGEIRGLVSEDGCDRGIEGAVTLLFLDVYTP